MHIKIRADQKTKIPKLHLSLVERKNEISNKKLREIDSLTHIKQE